jgi:TonB family protein
MKLILSLIAIITISGNVFGQTTRKISETPNIKEVYNVLESNESIKEGPYQQYSHFGNKLLCEGFYKNNQRDSLWKFYLYFNHLSEKGAYKDGKKVGIWDVYGSNGEQEIKYDYTNGKLLFVKSDPKIDTTKIAVINGTDTVKTILGRRPIYLEGNQGMYKVIGTNMRYPAKAKEKNIQGKVFIAFTIDSLGTTSNYKVKKGIGGGCEEEALRVVKLMNGDWLPGILNGRPITVEYILPLSFTLRVEDQ